MKKLIKLINIILLCGSLFWIFPLIPLHAQDSISADEEERASDVFELDAIVVTASKVKETVEDVPTHVSVITSEDIQESGAKNIIDLLGQESGIRAF